MRIRSYTVKYRQPGQWLWRKVKGVMGDGFVANDKVRYFTTDKDEMIYISSDAEVFFPPERQKVIERSMAAETGQQIQRA